ncbi:MAG: hypothetical protein ACYC9R_06345 [Nitrosotalea sp.]
MPTVTKRIRKHEPGKGWWSNEERIEAVKAYLLLGKIKLVCATTSIPEITLRKWKSQDWWKEAEEEYRKSSRIEVSGKLSNIINKTMVELEDRVSNGDYYFNQVTRSWERKKINANVLHKITSDLIDKQLVLEKNIAVEKVNDEGVMERLEKLKDEILKFARQKSNTKTIQGEVINVEILPVDSSVLPESVPQDTVNSSTSNHNADLERAANHTADTDGFAHPDSSS